MQESDERRPRFEASREQREELATHFFAAAEEGDLQGLEELLAHDVVLRGDGGGKAPALARAVHGRARAARTLPIRAGRLLEAAGWHVFESSDACQAPDGVDGYREAEACSCLDRVDDRGDSAFAVEDRAA